MRLRLKMRAGLLDGNDPIVEEQAEGRYEQGEPVEKTIKRSIFQTVVWDDEQSNPQSGVRRAETTL